VTSIQWPPIKNELWRQSGIWSIDRPESLENAIVVQNEQYFEEIASHESVSFSTMNHEDVFLNQMGPTQTLALTNGEYTYQMGGVPSSILSVAFNVEDKVKIHFDQSQADQHWQIRFFEFHLAEGAHLEITSQVNQKDSKAVVVWLVHQGGNSELHFSREHIEGTFVRDHVWVNQLGADAKSYLSGLYASHQQQMSEHVWTVSHQAPRGRSEQKMRGILNDTAKSVAISQVKVEKNIHAIESEQKLDHILLSDKATVHTRPQLEILSDDVICQHGITVGAIDEAALFYLQSRGIDKQLAMQLLSSGFFEKIWPEALSEPMSDKLTQVINKVGKHEFSK
jgi:Fe-S cluster assembly scaffold protein SufB